MKLSGRDKFQVATTVLFMVIGVTMLVRSVLLARRASSAAPPPPLLAYLLGVAFIGYGIYRICLIVQALRGRRPPG